jgi:hypothetical protein
MEHVAGPGCICGKEYFGYWILVKEMKADLVISKQASKQNTPLLP